LKIYPRFLAYPSGAGTILIVGSRRRARSSGKIFGRASTFFALKVQLVVSVSAFVVVSFLFSVFLLTNAKTIRDFISVAWRAMPSHL